MLAVAALAPSFGRTYSNGPPPGYTGGFGEPTCRACHAGAELAPAGALNLDLPAVCAAGARYRVGVTLRDSSLRRGGFQLAARIAEGERTGEQAGTLRATDGRVAIIVGARDVLYAQHTKDGSTVDADSATWTLEWVAPARAAGEAHIAFHVAANVANDDASELGDVIHVTERRLRCAGAPRD